MTENLSDLYELFVEWVFDHSNDNPLGEVEVAGFGSMHNLTSEACWTLLRHCKERGFVDDKHSTLGTPVANITNYGREWAEARKSRRGDKIQRKIAARNGLLVWLWEQKEAGRGYPLVDSFRKSPKAKFEGDILSENEIDRAAASLRDSGLIHGVEVAQRRGPVRAEPTNEGDRCIEQYSGDVMAYEQAKHKAGTNITFGGDNKGAFAVDSQHFEQHVTVFEGEKVAQVMSVVEQYRQAKPTINLPAEAEAEVVEVLEELEREVNSGTPDVGRIRRGLQFVGAHLNTAAAGALGNLIAAGALELAASLG
ncbi:hypothetical protein [Actinomadura sp. WMMA1423]|uniref:hypothetical protein n=1 Tax=Actinomadura sp. WMMA1423 TaxID=2591108 RepID=UPI0011468E61|nr:hypothetical protein [Actinomadura sp. WMMA1423]